jgi:hypothetical protein
MRTTIATPGFKVTLITTDEHRHVGFIPERTALTYVQPITYPVGGVYVPGYEMPNGMRYTAADAEAALNHGARFALANQLDLKSPDVFSTHADRF